VRVLALLPALSLLTGACSLGWGTEPQSAATPARAEPGTPYADPGMDTPAPSTEPSDPTVTHLDDPDQGLTIGEWTPLAPGLELGLFHSDVAHPVGDGTIRVVRIDPAHRELVVHTAVGVSEGSSQGWKGADAWARDHELFAVINASMFHPGGESVFALRTPDARHPTAWRDDASAALLIGPTGEGPAARLVDTACTGRERVDAYSTVVQNWRLIGCDRVPIWKRNGKIWSHALLGADGQGRILFIHARTPWNTRVFTEVLLGLPLDLRTLAYAEGGPEASLVVRAGGAERVWVGSYETGFTEHDRNRQTWNLPSVIGVR